MRPLGRGLCVFIAFCAVIMVWYGVWYIRAWHSARAWNMSGNESDLSFGIAACAIGVALIVFSIHMFGRARAYNREINSSL